MGSKRRLHGVTGKIFQDAPQPRIWHERPCEPLPGRDAANLARAPFDKLSQRRHEATAWKALESRADYLALGPVLSLGDAV